MSVSLLDLAPRIKMMMRRCLRNLVDFAIWRYPDDDDEGGEEDLSCWSSEREYDLIHPPHRERRLKIDRTSREREREGRGWI